MPDRIVRAGILGSDSVNNLSWAAEVFYRRLMSVVDDFGRYDGRLSVLRASLYPLKLDRVSEPDVAKWMGECSETALVRGYVVSGKSFVEILKFDQRLRAKRSKWPCPDDLLSSADTCQHMQAPFVSVSIPDSPKVGEGSAEGRGEIDRVNYLRDEACRLLGRPTGQPIACMDQLAMVEIVKRVGIADEIILIKKLKQSGYEYFPKSLRSLLQNWDKTVDTARNQAPPKSGGKEQTVIHGKELERVITKMAAIKSTYGDHQSWSETDRAEWNKLLTRKKELKAQLGVKV